jgi:RNA polymerase sigma-70 factor (ECF subfamily)
VPDLETAVASLLAGEVAAFRVLVNATMPRLFRLAARLMGGVEEAEDVLQDAYLRAYEALSNGRFDSRSGVETWLYRIVVNASLDALRSRQRIEKRPTMFSLQSLDSAQLEARVALRELADWVRALSPEQRTAILLKELEGLTAAEIAVAMGRSEGAVEQYLVRARAALRARRDHG